MKWGLGQAVYNITHTLTHTCPPTHTHTTHMPPHTYYTHHTHTHTHTHTLQLSVVVAKYLCRIEWNKCNKWPHSSQTTPLPFLATPKRGLYPYRNNSVEFGFVIITRTSLFGDTYICSGVRPEHISVDENNLRVPENCGMFSGHGSSKVPHRLCPRNGNECTR